MKSEDLLKHIGNVDDIFVDELLNDNVVGISAGKRNRRKWLTVAACFALIVLSAALLMIPGVSVDKGQMALTAAIADVPMAKNTIIMIDVNPSIQLEVNDRSVVMKAEARNDDGEAIISELQLEGSTCDEAVKSVLTALQDEGYISNLKNSLLLTVVNDDKENAEGIRAEILELIQNLDDETDYDFSVLSQIFTDVSELAEIAEANSMSEGRAALIQSICDMQEDYDFEALAKCNIQTINQLLEYIPLPECVERIGTAAGTVPEELKGDLNLDELSQEELIGFTMAISDFYDKLCECYDEADVANRIGYVFNIVCSETEEGAKQWAVLAESLVTELKTRGAIINLGDDAISDWYEQSIVKEIVDAFGG